MSKVLVTIICIAVTCALIAWDIFLAADKIDGNTISAIITNAAKNHPMIPFVLGVLIGHWLW
jgi:hypothetical protein